jgi:hypothetical protein
MIYVLSILFVKSEAVVEELMISLRENGEWRRLNRELQPSLVGTDLLVNLIDGAQSRTSLLSLEFWSSAQGRSGAMRSENRNELNRYLQDRGVRRIELGVFGFADSEKNRGPEIRLPGTSIDAPGAGQVLTSSSSDTT